MFKNIENRKKMFELPNTVKDININIWEAWQTGKQINSMKFISKHSEIKMPETKNKAKRHKNFWKHSRKAIVWMSIYLSTEIMETRESRKVFSKWWHKNCFLRIPNLVIITSKNKHEIKAKLTELCDVRTALKELLKENCQIKKQMIPEGNLKHQKWRKKNRNGKYLGKKENRILFPWFFKIH